MRVHQWPKNLFVFLPALTSQEFDEPSLFLAALKAFLAFCAIASAVYLINDLADLEHDRQHPVKRHRPFAAGPWWFSKSCFRGSRGSGRGDSHAWRACLACARCAAFSAHHDGRMLTSSAR